MNVRQYIDPRTFYQVPKELQYKEHKAYSNKIFSIDSAKGVWKDQNKNIITKIFLSVITAVAEIIFINPYQLTIGNVKNYFDNRKIDSLNEEIKQVRSSTSFKLKRYVKGTLKVCGLVLSTALALHLVGSAIFSGGKWINDKELLKGKLKNMPHYIMQTGLGMKKLGRWMFLSISVPTYSIFYKLPKFCMNKIYVMIQTIGTYIDKCLNFLKPYIIRGLNYVRSKLLFLIEKISKVLNFCLKPFRWAINSVIKPIATWCWTQITSVWNSIIKPILKIADRALNYLVESIIKPVATWCIRKITAAWNYLIQPLVNITKRAFLFLKNDIIKPIAAWCWTQITSAWNSIIKNVFQPLLNITRKAFENFVRPIVSWCWNKLTIVASAIYNNLVYPIAHRAFLLIKATWKLSAQIATSFYDIVSPTIISLGNMIYDSTMSVITTVSDVTSRIFARA